jgi:hypothetical protein
MTDTHMVSHSQLLHADNHIEMADPDVVFNLTLSCVNDAEAKVNTLSDLITKEQPVTRSH